MNEWWCLAAAADWIPETYRQDLPDYFATMIAYPEWMINSIRFEIVLNVFTDDLVTFTRTETTLIKGAFPDADVIHRAKACSTDWQRVLLFRKSE